MVGAADSVIAGMRDVLQPLHALCLLSPHELRGLVCGEQVIEWSLSSLLQWVQVGGGYSIKSPPVLYLFNTMIKMSQRERRAFLKFCTGCSTLPRGGLSALSPPLKIMQKIGALSMHQRLVVDNTAAAAAADGDDIMVDVEVGGGQEEEVGMMVHPSGGAVSIRRLSSPPSSQRPPSSLHDSVHVSASTCFHQIKLPPYSSQVLLERMLWESIVSSEGLIDLT